ncbi:hypothetical protein ACFSKM_19190 [Ancylobacter dichloromethanicus]
MRRNVPATLIPYGVDNWSPDRITLSRWNEDGVEIAADFPFALVDRSGGPLRLNNCGLDLPAAGAFEAEAPLAGRLAAHLARLSGQWNLMGARFVQRYFDFLAHRIATHRGQLEARLAPFDGLFRAEDFLYSAPVPLPRAFLYAPEPTPGGAGRGGGRSGPGRFRVLAGRRDARGAAGAVDTAAGRHPAAQGAPCSRRHRGCDLRPGGPRGPAVRPVPPASRARAERLLGRRDAALRARHLRRSALNRRPDVRRRCGTRRRSPRRS